MDWIYIWYIGISWWNTREVPFWLQYTNIWRSYSPFCANGGIFITRVTVLVLSHSPRDFLWRIMAMHCLSIQFSLAYYFYMIEDTNFKLCRNNNQHMKLCLPEKEVTPYLCSRVLPLLTILLVRPPPTPFKIFMPNLVEIITSSWYCACVKKKRYLRVFI